MLLQRFFQDRRASVASMFAISIIPVIGFIGAAVDYSRASSAKTAMQAALAARDGERLSGLLEPHHLNGLAAMRAALQSGQDGADEGVEDGFGRI